MTFAIPEAEREREDVKAIVGTAELAIDAAGVPVSGQRPDRARERGSQRLPGVEFLGNR